MDRTGLSLVEVSVAVFVLGIAVVGLLGLITYQVLDVSYQAKKNQAVHLAETILEEMADSSLEEIRTRDWGSWVLSNGYGQGLDNLQVQVAFPLVYDEEKNGYANQWSYTYANGYVWSGFAHPQYTKAVMEVDLTLTWTVRDRPMSYRVATIFSQIGR